MTPRPRPRLHREATDFLVTAVCLVFLVRGFVAEPYSIPTGSMAPGLLGRHKSAVCPKCGATVVVSTSEELDSAKGDSSVVSGVCGNCRREVDLSRTRSSEGDRVFVLKDPIGGYRRFDPVVFRNVDEPRTLLVKRVVGLPGETVRLHRGEIERLEPKTGWSIRRKPPELIRQMAVPVYDDRRRETGAPRRWVGTPAARWKADDGVYRGEPENADFAVLEYRHLLGQDGMVSLITDEMEYNSGVDAARAENAVFHRVARGHPVADLLVEFQLTVLQPNSEVKVHLQSGPDHLEWRAMFRDDGRTQQSFACNRDGVRIPTIAPVASARYCFGNVDRRMMLWRDDVLIGIREYQPSATEGPRSFPQKEDLRPVAIEILSGAVELKDLRVLRDVYYARAPNTLDFIPPRQNDWPSRPGLWDRLRRELNDSREWKIGPGQYFMLGDNSFRSRDSRRWSRSPFVDEQLLVGRAVLRTTPLARWARIPGGE